MRRLFIFVALLALVATVAPAQELTTGTIEGSVLAEDGTPIAEAVVTAMGPQGVRTSVTGDDGKYVIRGLISGNYQVKAEASGFSTVVQSDVQIYINRRVQLPFQLTAGITEQVTVTSRAALVDMKTTGTGATVRIDDFAPYVPLGRNLVSVMQIAPGVSDGGSIGAQNQSISGSSGLENAYFVDGVNVTNAGFGALGSYSIVYGSLGSGVTYDFLEEVQVKTGGFEAEYGQAGGGVVNTVVRSGTNKFKFDVAWYEEPTSLEGTRSNRVDFPNWANTEETLRRDISFSVGGPAVRDKLFFFAAYNPVTVEQDFRLTSGSGTNLYDLDGDGTADDSFEIGETIVGGRVPSSVTRERTIDNYAAKLSWFVNPNHRVEVTAFGDPSEGKTGPQDPNKFLRNLADPLGVPDVTAGAVGLDYGGDQISLKYQGVWTPNFFTEVILAQKENNFTETGPGTTFRSIFDVAANQSLGGSGFYEDKLDEVTQIGFKNTHVFGPVELSYGYQADDMEFSDPSFRSGDPFTAYLAVVDDILVDADGSGTIGDAGDFTDEDPVDGDPIYGLGFVNGCVDPSNFNDPNCYTQVNSTTGATIDLENGLYNVTRTAFEPLDAVTKNEEANAYAQVTWDALPNFTVKAGLRWTEQELTGSGTFDLDLGTTTESGRPTGLFTTNYTPKTYTFDSEIAPRLGVSWDVASNGKHKVFANYGEYFQRVPSDLAVRQFSNEVGIEGALYTGADLLTPSLSTDACWSADGLTSVDCHVIEGLTGAEPGVILNGMIDPAGDPDVGPNPATKLPSTEEFLVGYAWEINDHTGIEIRYIDRQLGRVLEDVQFASNEQIWNAFRGGLLFANEGGEVFKGHGTGSFGAYVLANPGENVNSTLFPTPVRDYNALEFVYTRRFHDGWMAYGNYRFAELDGNYEGSFRNDNGQSDPFITSLFDIPAASALPGGGFLESGTLKGQYILGPLNTDRRHIFNAFVSKQFDMGLNLGGRVTMRTGQPQGPLFAHPTYRNSGEIPGVNPTYWWLVSVDNDLITEPIGAGDPCDPAIAPMDLPAYCDGDPTNDPMGFGLITSDDGQLAVFPDADYDGDAVDDRVLGRAGGSAGLSRLFSYDAVQRDNLGRTPATVTFDMHASYDLDLSRGSKLTFLLDIFNVFDDNQQLTLDTAIETVPGARNPDYLRANGFQAPRNVRLGVKYAW